MAFSTDCSMCGKDIVTTGEFFTCADCRAWADHWASLTPEQRAAELAAMDAHVSSESEGN